jgi:hypothetical protein
MPRYGATIAFSIMTPDWKLRKIVEPNVQGVLKEIKCMKEQCEAMKRGWA